MSGIKESALELIGGTPVLRLNRYGAEAQKAQGVSILAKLEYLNPAGSAKDRIALAMVEDAEAKGILKPGASIIEPTSGLKVRSLTSTLTAAMLLLPHTSMGPSTGSEGY